MKTEEYNSKFKVPEGYFESQRKSLLKEIPNKRSINFSQPMLYRVLAVAALITLVVTVIWSVQLQNKQQLLAEAQAYESIDRFILRPDPIYVFEKETPKRLVIEPQTAAIEEDSNTQERAATSENNTSSKEEVILIEDETDELLYELFFEDESWQEEVELEEL